MADLATLDGVGLARLVAAGEVQPSELVALAAARCDDQNGRLNAVVVSLFDRAHGAAHGSLGRSALAGVPVLVKDLGAAMAGVRQTCGSRLLRDHVADHDDEIVRRMESAGMLICGRTNTPEFGLASTTEPALFGPACNPWNTSASTGGSSGGSAAAVAAGIVPIAHGNDGGGSLRIPASCCGVFGFKPTRGRVPIGPDREEVWCGLQVEGAITRSVRDSAAFLDVVSGPAAGDPYFAPPPATPFLESLEADAPRLRIAWTTAAFDGSPLHPECVAAVERAAHLCESLGHHVEEGVPRLETDALEATFAALVTHGAAYEVDRAVLRSGRSPGADDLEPFTRELWRSGSEASALENARARGERNAHSRRVAELFDPWDAVLTPTLREPPVRIGELNLSHDAADEAFTRDNAYVSFLPLANMTGRPAMSVPMGLSSGGLPIGCQFIGRYGADALLLRLAAEIEQAQPWSGLVPPTT